MRKVFSLFVILAVVLLGGCNLFSPPGPKLLYEERFSQGEGNTWFQGGGDTNRWWIADGKYHYEGQPQEWRGVKNSAAGQFQDSELKVDVEHISGIEDKSVARILFRVTDWNNYYSFEISPAGTYRLLKVVAGAWTTLKGWTAHDAIQKGPETNKVAVRAVGSQLTFFVNGQQVYQTTDDSLVGGQIGLGCGSYAGNTTLHIAFDNIEVWSVP
ncbi:DUF1080 domain-containing protein [Candidatus Bipolaricaulota bacterium]|nr:DUF1080 domain-containing protein [Candidatus Bipolaricaulota bacterium]